MQNFRFVKRVLRLTRQVTSLDQIHNGASGTEHPLDDGATHSLTGHGKMEGLMNHRHNAPHKVVFLTAERADGDRWEPKGVSTRAAKTLAL